MEKDLAEIKLNWNETTNLENYFKASILAGPVEVTIIIRR